MLVNINSIPKKIKKDGTVSKHRDISVLRTPGNTVNTNYGMFTVLEAKKEGKVWYITLTDATKTITVKQTQLFNKKLPKTATVQTTLMLAQPKDPLDTVVSEVENMCNTKCNQDDIIDQCIFICNNLRNDSCILNRYKRYLLSSYHPDSISGYANIDTFQRINLIFNF